jgi:threonine/homoserine/homoserine lactone efflux protein
MRFVVAVPVGWTLLLALCAAGIGALVVAMPSLRLAIKALGIGYLLWLAYKLSGSATLGKADGAKLSVGFGQGVMLQFVNIKAWLLALTLVAGWIAGQPDALRRFAIVAPVMLTYAFISNFAYALVGALLREWLAKGSRLLWFNRAMGLVLVLTAWWMVSV